MGDDLSNTKKIIRGELVIGDHDSLLVFGNDAQVGLNEFSKSLSNIITRNNNDLEDVIADLSEQLDKSQNKDFSPKGLDLFKSESRYIRDVIKEYNNILMNVDKMELSLKLQQAQLIKETKMLDYLEKNIETAISQIERIVEYGKRVSKQKEKTYESGSYEVDSWYDRLDKKIHDLEISHAIAIQNVVQIRLMRNNNYLLIDKIVSIIGTTLPIWRNQVSLILGIEKTKYNVAVQEKVLNLSTKQIEKSHSVLRKKDKKKIDWISLQGTNQQLIEVLKELSEYEREDSVIKNNIVS